MQQPLLSFIILTWNSEKHIEECLTSLLTITKTEKIPCEIYVVDNGSIDTTKHILQQFEKKHHQIVRPIFLSRNTGTTYSRNIALRKARGHFLCILDSDTVFLSGSFKEALNYLQQHTTVGILAPSLVLPTGEYQHSVKKFPTFFEKLLKLRNIFSKNSNTNPDYYEDFPFQTETFVDTAISACWLLKKSLLLEVGFLDENIFYAPEDIDYCLRIWQSGKKILFYPRLTILHKTQQITHKRPLSQISISHFLGLIYYFRKHGSWLSRQKFPQ
jgi:GT2 family glycosyltransferase